MKRLSARALTRRASRLSGERVGAARPALRVLLIRRWRITLTSMKTLTVKLPDPVFAEIAGAAKARKISKSDIVRERLTRSGASESSLWSRMEDLVIQRDSLPKDLSSNKAYLKNYGKNRSDR